MKKIIVAFFAVTMFEGALAASVLISWGSGATDIVTASKSMTGMGNTSLNLTAYANPAVGSGYYPNYVSESASPYFYAASTGDRFWVGDDAAGDYLYSRMNNSGDGQIFLWTKALFLNGGSNQTAVLSGMSAKIGDNGSATTSTVRFVIGLGAAYYISQTFGEGVRNFTNASSLAWYNYNIADYQTIGSSVTLTDFSDLTAAGLYVTANFLSTTAQSYVYDFSVTAELPPPPILFTENPTVQQSDNGNGTYIFTLNTGSASGTPAPILSGVLMLDGIEVTSGITNMTYVASQLAQEQELIWTVTASNGVNPDGHASITNMIPSLYGIAPDRVTGLKVTAGDAQNVLSWIAPADNGETIADYLIEVDSGNGFVRLSDGVNPVTNYVHSGLNNDKTYTYRVAAVNEPGAAGLFSSSASGTPVMFLLKPSFLISPSLVCTSTGDGTMTCIMTPGTVTGAPLPVVTAVLTVNGTNITDAVTNGVYVALLRPDPQLLVWTVTASNGVVSNAVFSASQIIPSSKGITLNSFSRDMSIFDSDCARGRNRADIPVRGTVVNNGTVIEVRPVYADTGDPVPGLTWQAVPPAVGGAWSGSYTGVYRTAEWLRMEARVKDGTDPAVQMTNRFAAGYVIFIEEQSNTHQGLKPDMDYAAQNAAAAGDPFPVTIGNQPGDFQFVWLGDDGNSPTPIIYISDANPHTTSLAAMAETFAKTTPGMKVMVGFDTLSGSAPSAPLNDSDTSRSWSNSVWLAGVLQADGSEVGIAWANHFQGTTDPQTWLVGAYLGCNLDGTVRPELTLDPAGFPAQTIAGSKVNHIWPAIYPGLLNGRMQILRAGQGSTYASTITADDFVITTDNEAVMLQNFPDHFTPYAGFYGQLVQPEGDVHWDKADVERGFPQKVRLMAVQFLRAGGFVTIPNPTIDHVVYTPEHITVWSDAGPITTIRKLKGIITNYPVDPNATPPVESDLEVIGFTDERLQNTARTEIVDENGNSAAAGRIRIYPAEGKQFDDSTRLFYLIAKSGYQKLPWISQQRYTDTYLYDCYPIVDIGVPTIFGQILQPTDDIFALSKRNDLPSSAPDFTVERGNPAFSASGYLASQSTTNYTVEVEFRRQIGQPFYISSSSDSSSYWMKIGLSMYGDITVAFRTQTGALFSGIVSSNDVPCTADGFHTFRVAINLSTGQIELFMDGVAVDNQTAPQFGTNTVLSAGSTFRSSQYVNVFTNNSGGDVRRFRAWADYAPGGAVPSSIPWLEVVANPAGAFASSAGGRYDVLDRGVVRTNGTFAVNDADGDGIPDVWEFQYFGGNTNASPGALAANGHNTVREAYIAGISPTDAQAKFDISALSQNGQIGLQWNAVSGRVYSVYWTTNLFNGFQCLDSNIVWPQSNWPCQVGNPQESFYQIRVQLVP